jgi:hypothetical protein
MPKKQGVFLRLISIGYEGKLRNRRVCKKLPIFMGEELLFNGKALHISSVRN